VTDLLLFCLLGVLSTAIAVLGGYLSSNNRNYRMAFYVLGALSIILVLFTGYRTYSAQIAAKNESKRLDDTIKTIKNMSEESVRIGTLNKQLEEQLLDESKAITSLSKLSINNATGGDSFCYLFIKPTEDGKGWYPNFFHSGKYPLYGVNARFVDLEKFNDIIKKHQQITFQDLDDNSFHIGDMITGTSLPIWNIIIPWSDAQSHAYNIFFSARNGLWDQKVRLRKINGQWVRATLVKKQTANKSQILFQMIDKSFPRNSKGEVDWD
jgi:hypothetical protein